MYDTEVLKSNPWCYNDAYIPSRGNITSNEHNQATQVQVVFENPAPFIKCITKIDGTI